MPIIEGTLGRSLLTTDAPVNGTDEVQTLTIGGTPTSGTFRLKYEGFTTGPITWSNVNATLVAAINAALVALPSIGAGGVVTAIGTMTAGIGTATITFSGANLAKTAVPTISVAENALIGTTPTVAVAETTPGVTATFRNAAPGAQLMRYAGANSKLYVNIGATAGAPTWVSAGSQT